jgi:hypothetical protein
MKLILKTKLQRYRKIAYLMESNKKQIKLIPEPEPDQLSLNHFFDK